MVLLSLGPGRVESNSVGLQRVFFSSLRMSFHQPLLVYDRIHPVRPPTFFTKRVHSYPVFLYHSLVHGKPVCC